MAPQASVYIAIHCHRVQYEAFEMDSIYCKVVDLASDETFNNFE